MSQIMPISIMQAGLKLPAQYASTKTPQLISELNSLAANKNVSLNKVIDLLEAALSLAEKVLELIIKREASAKNTSPVTTSDGKPPASAVSNELLWKPKSEKDNNLVVLIPSSYSASVQSVRVLSASGERTLGVGTASGTSNGGRAHFRFKKPGSAFPSGSILEIKLNDGTLKRIPIAEPAKRWAKAGG